jgi:hypothetical protein
MQHGQPQHLTHPRAQRIRAKVEQQKAGQTTFAAAPERLTLSIQLLNQLLNEQSHRPDAVRLLREILRERAIHQEIKNWDANSLFG